jgi:phage terminase small subunit
MGSRGPIPKPDSSETKRGRNTMYKKTPTAPAAGVSPPSTLAGPALDFWNAHAPQLVADGRLRDDQAEAFGILCQIAADCRLLSEQVAAEGWITATDKGQAISPVAKLLRESRLDFIKYAKEFGLTAASSIRLPQDKPNGEEEGDEEDQVLRKLSIRRA